MQLSILTLNVVGYCASDFTNINKHPCFGFTRLFAGLLLFLWLGGKLSPQPLLQMRTTKCKSPSYMHYMSQLNFVTFTKTIIRRSFNEHQCKFVTIQKLRMPKRTTSTVSFLNLVTFTKNIIRHTYYTYYIRHSFNEHQCKFVNPGLLSRPWQGFCGGPKIFGPATAILPDPLLRLCSISTLYRKVDAPMYPENLDVC